MKKVLVTGAGGFIGQRLCAFLLGQGLKVTGVVRRSTAFIEGIETVVIPNLTDFYEWDSLLKGVDVVFHLAGQAHAVKEGKLDSYVYAVDKLKAINIDVTVCLAKAALTMGVKRFVYLSSIKVNGDSSHQTPFSEESLPMPEDNYGESKYQAETQLHRLVGKTSLELVIMRPPLVYGPGVKGNFWDLLRLSRSSYWLPFASITNQRSFIYVDNLVSALYLCGVHPKACGKTFLIRDGTDVSVPQLILKIRKCMKLPPRLFLCPLWFLRGLAILLGRQEAFYRLTGSLQVDDTFIREVLDWKPLFTFEEGLRETVAWFLKGLD